MTEEQLELKFYGPKLSSTAPRPMPSWLEVHTELKRPGVTLELLHLEHLEQHPEDGYRYSRFRQLYEKWLKRQRLSMRPVHSSTAGRSRGRWSCRSSGTPTRATPPPRTCSSSRSL